MSRCDLLIIGGGVNGLGIAADAAARGLRVLLADRRDFASGTTAASTRLIHGGLRYLQYGELGLVRESLRERELLLRRRPHLVRPLELMIPWYDGQQPPAWKLALGLRLYAALGGSRGPRELARAAVEEREPHLERERLRRAFLFHDAQVEFPERLCVELLREARSAGAELLNYAAVERLRLERGRVTGAELRDELSGAGRTVEARVVVNAAGPWVDQVNASLPRPPARLLGGTRGSHLILPRRDRGPRHALYVPARRDGRPIFLLPWDGRLLVGTTDVPHTGSPDALRVEEWEVEYLLEEVRRLFPESGYTAGEILFTTVGVRPLPASGRPAAAVTRRHFLVDHGPRDGAQGLASVVGGKLTTYRSLSERVVEWVFRQLGLPAPPCPTRDAPKPGTPPAEPPLPEAVRSRLERLYGPYLPEVLRDAAEAPGRSIREEVLDAEVLHAARREGARTLDDLLSRRLMLLPATAPERAAAARICLRHGLPVTGLPSGPAAET